MLERHLERNRTVPGWFEAFSLGVFLVLQQRFLLGLDQGSPHYIHHTTPHRTIVCTHVVR